MHGGGAQGRNSLLARPRLGYSLGAHSAPEPRSVPDDRATVPADAPRRHLGVAHATILALGMIMTTDTLKTAPTVALNIGGWHFYGMWVLGGLLSMIGAMVYVEMATAFPDPGGDYNFLSKAYGREVGLLFAWSRFSIMHTGWIALMAFMFADYAAALIPMNPVGHTLFALATVGALVGLNLMHVKTGFITQAALVGLVALGFASVVAAAVKLGVEGQLPAAAVPPAPAVMPSLKQMSVALIYIFLAYGGWSDAATLSAEVRSDRRGMLAAIIGSLTALMVIYLVLNGAMLAGLGPTGLAHATAPAADLTGRAFGDAGKTLIVLVVGVSAIASINSTLIIGAAHDLRRHPGPAGAGLHRPLGRPAGRAGAGGAGGGRLRHAAGGGRRLRHFRLQRHGQLYDAGLLAVHHGQHGRPDDPAPPLPRDAATGEDAALSPVPGQLPAHRRLYVRLLAVRPGRRRPLWGRRPGRGGGPDLGRARLAAKAAGAGGMIGARAT